MDTEPYDVARQVVELMSDIISALESATSFVCEKAVEAGIQEPVREIVFQILIREVWDQLEQLNDIGGDELAEGG